MISDEFVEASAERTKLELFPGWRNEPIKGLIAETLQGCENIDGTFFVSHGDSQYLPLRKLLAETVATLPLNNEVGKTRLAGEDAREALADIVAVAQGQKTWSDIEWVFQRSTMELYKNEVYKNHSIPQAICYSIDLGINRHSIENPHRVIIQRILVINRSGRFVVKMDGKFTLKDNEIEVDSANIPLNIHNF